MTPSRICRRCFLSWQWSRYVVVVAIAVLAIATPVWAQDGDAAPAASPESAAETTGNPLPNTPFTQPLGDLAPLGGIDTLFQNGPDGTEVASIHLDGRPLFDIAASNEEGTLTANERAAEIESRLRRAARDFATDANIGALEVKYHIDQESNQPVIDVNDEPVMTVTYLDARLNGANSLTLRASQIVNDVEAALIRYHDERQPEFLWSQVRWTLATLLIALLGSYAISHFRHQVIKRRRLLRASQSTPATVDGLSSPGRTNVNRIRSTLLTRQQINSLGILKEFLRLLQVVIWFASTLLILGLFPYTRWLQPLIVGIMRVPIRFLIVGLIAYGLIRISSLWIDRIFLAFQTRTAATIERSQRLVLRLSTFSQVVKGIVAFIIAGTAFLVMLSLLGIRVAPLLAGAGLLGFAISFASQSLIKDIINGFLVLLEDQYGVGDVITVKSMSGFVETMNLRITQLRATDGQLITIPNGQIDIVQNLSKEWSRVDLMIPVGLDADINKALEIVEAVANDMRNDDIWGSLILEPPLLLGVDELSHAGATIRIWIKTQPLKQWDVAREYRRRLKMAFESAGISIGVPQQVIQLSGRHVEEGHTQTVPPSDLLSEDLAHPADVPS